jgi:hypothetical protein
MGTRPITATYSGSAHYATSVSTALTQDIVNGSAAGLVFSNVKVNNLAAVPVCTGMPGTGYTCTVVGGINAVVSAQAGFGTSLAAPVAYSAQVQSIGWTSSGRAPGSGTVTVLANATTSTTTLSSTKNSINSASITVTFTESGGTTWSAVLTVT